AEIHTAGLIIAGTFWDILETLDLTLDRAEALAICRRLWLDHMVFETGVIAPQLVIDVLMADDDDGNILNGTPHDDAILSGFAAHGLEPPAFEWFAMQATPLPDTVDEIGPYPVSIEVASLSGSPVQSVTLTVSTDGGVSNIDLAETAPGTYEGSIPGQLAPAGVHYFYTATDALGHAQSYPEGAPDHPPLFLVGALETIFFEPVGSTAGGFSHSAAAGQDDWQRGTPNVQGTNPWDPLVASSPPYVWGNDLNPFGWNGDYPSDSHNALVLPPIDLSGRSNTKLRYRRWLTVERAPYDIARVVVEGTVIWQNPSTKDWIDTSWVEVTHDIAPWADGNPAVDIRFELETNGLVEFGGWNLDDFELLTVGPLSDPFDRGDCNSDGARDLADPIALLGHLYEGLSVPDCADACDADDDGALTLDDALSMLETFFLDGAPLPEPYPESGIDPTPDGLRCR
ncbi:MAG: hypothetical protein KDC38_08505, partial [Planctomycetes bacterium]|nr:hypothetical protein [Planctomycetota bacterium]